MRGFTLLEVLISLGVLVVITSALYATYTGNLQAVEAVRDQEISFQTARVVLDLMERDLTSAVGAVQEEGKEPDERMGFVAESLEYEGLPTDRMQFTCNTHIAWSETSPRTDLCEVGYILEEDGETGKLTLYRRDQAMPDGDLEQGGETMVLSKDVTSLDLLFYDKEGQEFEEWDSRTGDKSGEFPLKVRIRLTVRGLSGLETAFTTDVHLMAAGLGEME